jgi:hypothetical protein
MRQLLRQLEEAASVKVNTECRPWTGNNFTRKRVCRNGLLTSFYSGGDKPYAFKSVYQVDGETTEDRGGPFDSGSESEKAATDAYMKWRKGLPKEITGWQWQ